MSNLDAIKAATWPLHMRAERTGIVADILAGRASRFGVALFLRNLLPVYQVLDATPFARPVLMRAALLAADVAVIVPDGGLPLLPEAAAYADRVAAADGDRMIAHAYVRYLGDLNGGRIMARRMTACLGAVGGALRSHAYPVLDDVRAFAEWYRAELDRAVRGADFEAVRVEAGVAFEAAIAVSQAVKAAAAID
jgi:heme oxygenase